MMFSLVTGVQTCALPVSFARFCVATAELPPRKAVPAQRSLLRLFDQEALAGQIELVVRALLEPWISEKPEPEHRKAISEFLLDQVGDPRLPRSEEHTSALQSLMRISYAVFCLKKKNTY